MMSKQDPFADMKRTLGRVRLKQKARRLRGEKPPPNPMQAVYDADRRIQVEADSKWAQKLSGGRRVSPPTGE